MQHTVADQFFGGEKISGEVGIEIELEGHPLPTGVTGKIPKEKRYWVVTPDGSLRGEAAEYVLARPVDRKDVKAALDQLAHNLEGVELEDSGRAGVHVHINVRDLTMVQMFTFVLLYLVFERVLVRFCGEQRQGNLFCLRVEDAEYLSYALHRAIKTRGYSHLSSDELRYASINLTALSKYGSLEFRAMRSPVAHEVIEQWVELLLALKDSACKFTDPEDLLIGVSQQGGIDFARQILGDKQLILGDVDWNSEVMDGLRRIQPSVKALSKSMKYVEPVKEKTSSKSFRIESGGILRYQVTEADWESVTPMATRELRNPAQDYRNEVRDTIITMLPQHIPESFTWVRR